MNRGKIKFYNSDKGFGFIVPEQGGQDIFFHVSACRTHDFGTPVDGERVEYSLDERNGKPCAVDLKRP